jgi:multiple sugar transport system ATP-binding protein
LAQVKLKDLAKKYPNADALAVKEISLDIEDKEFLVLVGPSGCGKTTTLRMVAGLEEITSGEIWIGDRLVNEVEPKDRDIAMVFQNYALYPHMNVYENLAFGLRLRRFPRAEIDRRVKEAAEILSIGGLLKRKTKELSGGQKQRVALGRAIVRNPAVFLMDEPLSNLDAKLRVQMRTEISKLHQRVATTFIYVTHDQVEAMTMGHRIVVMNNGVIMQAASPQELYDHPRNKFVAGFIGSPPMNFMTGQLEESGNGLYFVGTGFRFRITEEYRQDSESAMGRELFLGIRPEDVHVGSDAERQWPEMQYRTQVELVEPLGAEQHVLLSTDVDPIVSRVPPDMRVRPGDNLTVTLAPHKLHIFDGETEEAYF